MHVLCSYNLVICYVYAKYDLLISYTFTYVYLMMTDTKSPSVLLYHSLQVALWLPLVDAHVASTV